LLCLPLIHRPASISDQMSRGSPQEFLNSLLYRIPKVSSVVVTDRDGVLLLNAVDESLSVAESPIADFSVGYNSSAEQAGKLGLGSNRYIISMYQDWCMMQLNLNPIILTIIAEPSVNIGMIINAIPEINLHLENIRAGVAKHQQEQQVERGNP